MLLWMDNHSHTPQLPPLSSRSSMSSEPTKDKSWDSCPTGLISQTAELRLETPLEQRKRQRRTILWAGVSLALLLMLISYSLIDARPAAPSQEAAVSCQTVRGNLAAFCNNQIHEVSLERQIGKHLIDCKSCRKEYRSTCKSPERCPNRIRQGVAKPNLAERYN